MRIAYVCADRGVPVFGAKGCSIHVQEVVGALRKRGVEIDMFVSETGGEAPAHLEDVPIHSLTSIRESDVGTRELAAYAANDSLREALAQSGPIDAVYERHSLWSYAGMEYARSQGIPGLLEVNAPLLKEQRTYRGLIHEHDAKQAVHRAYSAAHDLLAVSEEVAKYLRETGWVGGTIHVVPNGVDPARFNPDCAPAHQGTAGLFTIGFVGGLRPWHGVGDLLEAFARVRSIESQVQLLIVGDGPLREELEDLARDLDIADSVVFTGRVDPSVVPAILTSMDVAVAPYPALDDFYFSPLKLFEYMAAGRAIVASVIGQITEVLVEGETGLLYPPGDVEALAAALLRLKQKPAIRHSIGQAARIAAMGQHSWDAVAHTIMSIVRMRTSTDAIPHAQETR